MTDNEYCTFRLDELTFGIEVHQVQEVIRPQVLTPVPRANGVVEGLINLRGQIVTAIDLRRRLELQDRPEGREAMNVVVRTAEGEVSFLVDEIGDVVQVDDASFETPPDTVQGVARELITGAYKLEDRLLLILDVPRTVQLPAPA
ncbi:chemotaxis protein CheW [Egicoccus sp. AB-alg6-2]|uniref:chemotaxis protein CheW n=1 Tax=Egicoccus sp. AB-alg6-2 TaxID=3242692 RepID=UPI00359DAFFC